MNLISHLISLVSEVIYPTGVSDFTKAADAQKERSLIQDQSRQFVTATLSVHRMKHSKRHKTEMKHKQDEQVQP